MSVTISKFFMTVCWLKTICQAWDEQNDIRLRKSQSEWKRSKEQRYKQSSTYSELQHSASA